MSFVIKNYPLNSTLNLDEFIRNRLVQYFDEQRDAVDD
jgi:hypothetical protein